MKNLFRLFIPILLIGVSCIGCSLEESNNDQIYGTTGTVIYVDLEGGFYGIISVNGNYYDPINLPVGFHEDGIHVRFLYIIRDAQMSIHQWGTLIEIVSVERLN